ncbi:hypothetical protein Mesci_5667 [Mesorhizobium ciceri biovar biserrulae WSM1271]|uniref:T6SS Transcription factor RovC-like DNA binding domain-containing protein n=2 Tax=Mesorhizobium TaxID=68287 RepID=E8TGN4_MESCW|nr:MULTISPECIES: DUF2285 domain-containing protein [Mesorhizobium]ADV14747.1 hypothetical protein Mesci_5667 [Mesorhizobium ciceri biovar biserrulae WSM1271]AEH90634.1 Protein of unknown function DUF2285 [Mesorhizobium opportunistum WSM2075]
MWSRWPANCHAGVFCFAESHGRNSVVFWSPLWCAHVLPVIAEQLSAWSGTAPFELSALPCRSTVLLAPDKGQHVLLRDTEHTLQLAVSGADILHPVCLRTEAIWPETLSKHRLRAIESLNRLNVGQQLPARLFPPEKRGPRLTFVLRALDGSLAGASHRELAEALIGQQRVHADWRDPRDHLRDRIRRAVSRGRALMHGGYRDFLL